VSNPFIDYRWLLSSYGLAMESGWSDSDFIALVERLDDAVAEVDGHGFSVTPLMESPGTAKALDLRTERLWVKDDTNNVGGSHKARHLFGTMLHLAVQHRDEGELAIASCGNAAIAASVVAKAMDRQIRVFIPTWADEPTVRKLESLDAHIEVCPRREGEAGDPAYLSFLMALDRGAIPFSVQGSVTPSAIDGGRTIGWEIATQLGLAGVEGRVRLFAQIGGGALASAAWQGLTEGVNQQWVMADPMLHAVQTEACAPLVRAWDRITVEISERNELVLPNTRPMRADAIAFADPLFIDEAIETACEEQDRFMWAWEAVGHSAASGILDDVTYDWLTVVEPMLRSGGWPIVVSESQVLKAHEIGRSNTGINVSATGTAGLAGLLDDQTADQVLHEDTVVLLFTGVER
jgi:threonine synthase